MKNGEVSDLDVRGRMIAHVFYGELEKIAAKLPRSAADIAEAMGRSGKETRRLRAVSKPWYDPRAWIGEEGTSFRAVKARGKKKHKKLKGEMSAARSAAHEALTSGNKEARKKALKWLEDAKENPHVSFEAKPPRKGMSPLAQKAALGLGAAGAGAAGLAYVQNRSRQQQDPYGGY